MTVASDYERASEAVAVITLAALYPDGVEADDMIRDSPNVVELAEALAGIAGSLIHAIADELHVPPSAVTARMGSNVVQHFPQADA